MFVIAVTCDAILRAAYPGEIDWFDYVGAEPTAILTASVVSSEMGLTLDH